MKERNLGLSLEKGFLGYGGQELVQLLFAFKQKAGKQPLLIRAVTPLHGENMVGQPALGFWLNNAWSSKTGSLHSGNTVK